MPHGMLPHLFKIRSAGLSVFQQITDPGLCETLRYRLNCLTNLLFILVL